MPNQTPSNPLRSATFKGVRDCLILIPLAIGGGIFFANHEAAQNAAAPRPPAPQAAAPQLPTPPLASAHPDADNDHHKKSKRSKSGGGRVGAFKRMVELISDMPAASKPTGPARPQPK